MWFLAAADFADFDRLFVKGIHQSIFYIDINTYVDRK